MLVRARHRFQARHLQVQVQGAIRWQSRCPDLAAMNMTGSTKLRTPIGCRLVDRPALLNGHVISQGHGGFTTSDERETVTGPDGDPLAASLCRTVAKKRVRAVSVTPVA